jgi:hypothetical protein
MVGITGIGNLNGPQQARTVKDARDLPTGERGQEKQDGFQISPEGSEAVEVARFAKESARATEIRQERIEAAKKNLEQGRHRVEEVVNAVAATLVGYI